MVTDAFAAAVADTFATTPERNDSGSAFRSTTFADTCGSAAAAAATADFLAADEATLTGTDVPPAGQTGAGSVTCLPGRAGQPLPPTSPPSRSSLSTWPLRGSGLAGSA